MLAKERRWHGVRDLVFDGALDDRRLLAAPRQQHHVLGVQDGSDAHRDGGLGHLVLAAKVAGRVGDRLAMQVYEARGRMLHDECQNARSRLGDA